MLGEVAALLGALCFAISSVLIRRALDRVGPWWVNLVRTLSASVFLLPLTVLWRWGELVTFRGLSALYVFLGVFFSLLIGDLLYFMGLRDVGVARAMPLSNTYSLFSMVFAALFLGEPVTVFLVVGVMLAFVGVQIIVFEPPSAFNVSYKKRGLLMSLIAAVFWAIGSIFFRTALTQEDYVATAVLRMWILSLLLLTGTFIRGGYGALHSAGRNTLLRVAVAGVISHGVGSILYMMSLSLLGAARGVPLISVAPLFGLLLAFSTLKEKVTARIWAGSLLTVIGIATITLS